jgi:lipoprotein signal peptidase
MERLVAGVGLILVADQLIKAGMLRWLSARAVPLGSVGRLEIVHGRFWWCRAGLSPQPGWIWSLWGSAAAALIAMAAWRPSLQIVVALLLGGSLSHALETTCRGHVIDYLWLRSWFACNLADLAMTAGSLGILWQLLLRPWPSWP